MPRMLMFEEADNDINPGYNVRLHYTQIWTNICIYYCRVIIVHAWMNIVSTIGDETITMKA